MYKAVGTDCKDKEFAQFFIEEFLHANLLFSECLGECQGIHKFYCADFFSFLYTQ